MAEHKYGLNQFGDGTGIYRPQSSKERTETAITKDTIDVLKVLFPYAFVLKVHGGDYQRAGVPDIYIMTCGKSIWIEMKRPGADTTALQKRKLQALSDAGAFCGTAESPERAVEIVKEVLSF